MKVLELYCGIGGVATALATLPASGPEPSDLEGKHGACIEVVGAIDINRIALEVYAFNHLHPTFARQVDSFSTGELARFEADLWWASPPCQPFTRRGHGRGLDDPRAGTFLALLDRLAAVRPRYFAMENVIGFDRSEARDRLLEVLGTAGYRSIAEQCICPSELGIPNRRPRYYLVAARDSDLLPSEGGASSAEGGEPVNPESRPGLEGYWDPDEQQLIRRWGEELMVDPELEQRYRGALHVVNPSTGDGLPTACFTSAYGRSHVRSGSYLGRAKGGLRRFAPTEILRLLDFPPSYALPSGLRLSNAWRLLGNSLSLAPVRLVLGRIPELAHGGTGIRHQPSPLPKSGSKKTVRPNERM